MKDIHSPVCARLRNMAASTVCIRDNKHITIGMLSCF